MRPRVNYKRDPGGKPYYCLSPHHPLSINSKRKTWFFRYNSPRGKSTLPARRYHHLSYHRHRGTSVAYVPTISSPRCRRKPLKIVGKAIMPLQLFGLQDLSKLLQIKQMNTWFERAQKDGSNLARISPNRHWDQRESTVKVTLPYVVAVPPWGQLPASSGH